MKTSITKSVITTLIALASSLQVQAADSYPSLVTSTNLTKLPYKVSGVIWGRQLDPAKTWQGSGTVAVDPRLAVSCAHVVFENGTWLQNFNFAAAHHSSTAPSKSTNRVAFRGYKALAGYSGGSSNDAFSRDLVVQYAYRSLAGGDFARLVSSTDQDGTVFGDFINLAYFPDAFHHPLATERKKLIIGYPGSNRYYMNSVGPFSSSYGPTSGWWPWDNRSGDRYLWNGDVMADDGMSGGGVFVDAGGGDYRLAGVLLSGPTDGSMGAGVRAWDGEAYLLIKSALARANKAKESTFSSSNRMNIPDNSSTWTVRNFSVSSMPANIMEVKVSVDIIHSYRGDLEVTLTSPAGRVTTLKNRNGNFRFDQADNVVISNLDVSSSFSSSNPNGTWKLSMRDLGSGDVGYLNSVSLTITAR